MSLLEERLARPTHQGPVEGGRSGVVGNPACGDLLTVHVKVEGGKVVAAGFESMGSPYQLATASVLCDCVEGHAVAEARARGPDCVLERLPDLPERHHYLARLAVEALALALDAAEGKGSSGRSVETRTLLEDDQAQRFVVDLLEEGPRTTEAVEAAARAAGVLLPVSTAKTLARLRQDGVIEGAMDVTRRAWSWRAPPERATRQGPGSGGATP